MIKVIKENDIKDGYYELMTSQVITSLKGAQSLSVFEDAFKTEIKKIPKKSIATADSVYRIIWVGDQYVDPNAFLQVWHIDNNGNKDKLIATITKQ